MPVIEIKTPEQFDQLTQRTSTEKLVIVDFNAEVYYTNSVVWTL
jgi:hypothetical protein